MNLHYNVNNMSSLKFSQLKLDDKSMQLKMQEIVELETKNQKNHKYIKKFKLPNTKYSVNNCNNFNTSLLTSTQYLFNKTLNNLSNDKNKYRGLIGWLSTGAGKSTIAAGIINKFMFKNKQIYYISRHDALKPIEEFKTILKDNYQNTEDLKNIFHIMSIVKFANRLIKNQIDLSKSVIIIDEAQYLFPSKAVPHLKEKHQYLLNILQSKLSLNSYVFILTATPGENVSECLDLLNIVRNKNENKANIDNYKNILLGKIFYLDMSKDLSIFPSVQFFKHNANIISEKHNLKLMLKLHESRILNETKRLKYIQKWNNNLFTNEYFSSKFEKMIKMIIEYPNDKHYIYSQYGNQGIDDIKKLLEKKMFKEVSSKNLNVISKKFLIAKASNHFVTGSSKNISLKKFNDKSNKNGKYIQVFLATDSYNTGLDLKDILHIHFLEPPLSYVDVIQGIGRGVRMCSHKNLPKSEWHVNVHTYFNIPNFKKLLENGANSITLKNMKMSTKKFTNILHKLQNDSLFKTLQNYEFSIDKMIYTKSKSDYSNLENVLNEFKRYAIDCKALYYFHTGKLKNKPYKCIYSKNIKIKHFK